MTAQANVIVSHDAVQQYLNSLRKTDQALDEALRIASAEWREIDMSEIDPNFETADAEYC